MNSVAVRFFVRAIFVVTVTPTLVSCYRYVETARPMTSKDCAPELPRGGFFRAGSGGGRSGVISGRLLDADHPDSLTAGLAQGWIRVAGRTVATDSVGHFIVQLSTGRYAVQTSRIGYQPRTDSVVVSDGSAVTLAIGLVPQMLDGCPGFAMIVTRERKWRWW